MEKKRETFRLGINKHFIVKRFVEQHLHKLLCSDESGKYDLEKEEQELEARHKLMMMNKRFESLESTKYTLATEFYTEVYIYVGENGMGGGIRAGIYMRQKCWNIRINTLEKNYMHQIYSKVFF